MMPSLRRGRGLWIAMGVAAIGALVSASTVQRVPVGHVGVDATGSLHAGWSVHRPFSPYRVIASRGDLSLKPIVLQTAEGSRLDFALNLHYTLAPRLATQLALDIRSEGLDAAVTGLAQKGLAEISRATDIETLLSQPSRSDFAIAAALGGAGIMTEGLSLQSTLGDEVIRRRRTIEAASLTAAPLARMLLVGWDGADWRLADPLIAAGKMPHLARLKREGAWGDLRSSDPMFSPLLWTTIATGKAPTEHGIADFLVKDKSTGQRHPITSDFRKVKALWNILGDFDRTSCWIAWWASFPAEEIRGTIVTDYLAAAVGKGGADQAIAVPGIASPKDALKTAGPLFVSAARITREEVGAIIPVSESDYRAALADLARASGKKDDKSRVDDPVSFVMRVLAQARTYHNLALAQLRAGTPFVAVYYEAIDMMGHGFQHFLPPKMSFVSDADFARFHDAVPNFYIWQDQRLGELLAAAGDRTLTVLVSDHGFRTGDDRPNFAPSIKGQPEEWHRDWGIVALHGPGIAPGRLAPSSIFDITPTLLYAAGLPLAEDMPGRLIAGAFEPATIRRRVPSRIKSYELVGERLTHAAAVQADPEVMREMMANLKALGYVGGNDETAPGAVARSAPGTSSAREAGASDTQYFYHRNLAESYFRQGRFREAEAELLKANERQARAKTYAMLSEVRAQDGRYAEAAEALEDGWLHVPSEMEPSSLLWIVELRLLGEGHASAARAAARWGPQMRPAVKDAVDGRLAEDTGDGTAAREAYRRALEADPLLVRVVLRLQSLDAGAGRPFEMEPFLLRALATHPEIDAYWDLAGQIALARGDFPSAADRFRHATDIEPENASYLGHLASAEAAAGRPQQARDALAWADRFPPRDADGWMAVGSAWDRLGETNQAVAAFGRARDSQHAGPGADIGAALALARAGRTAEARRVLDDGLRRYPDSAALRQLSVRLGGS